MKVFNMEKIEAFGITFYEVDLGWISFQAFEPEELVERMAAMNFSLN
jgi:hypothetical protein